MTRADLRFFWRKDVPRVNHWRFEVSWQNMYEAPMKVLSTWTCPWTEPCLYESPIQDRPLWAKDIKYISYRSCNSLWKPLGETKYRSSSPVVLRALATQGRDSFYHFDQVKWKRREEINNIHGSMEYSGPLLNCNFLKCHALSPTSWCTWFRLRIWTPPRNLTMVVLEFSL